MPVRALPSNLLTSNLYFYECFMKNAATPSNSSQTKRYLLLCNPDFLTNELTKKRFFSFSRTSVPPQSRVRGGSRGRVQGVRNPPSPEMSCGFLIQLVFCKQKTMWFIGVEVEQETSAPPPKKNPGSAPEGGWSRGGSGAVAGGFGA